MEDRYYVRPIGFVRSPWSDRAEIPIQGGPASVEVLPEFEMALDGIERVSHVIVIAFLHQAPRDVLVSRPRRLDPNAPACGVFASRSPARPNPIAISATRLLGREGLILRLDPLDFLDGTPVVDIKSYSPGWDCVFSARSQRRIRQSALDDKTLMAFLERDLINHLGDAATHKEAHIALSAVAAAVRAFDVDARDQRLAVCVSHPGLLADALMGLTGATFNSGRIRFAPSLSREEVIFLFEGHKFKYP